MRYCHCICLLTTQPHVTNICLYSLRSGLRSEGLLAIRLMSSVIRSTVILTWICSPSFASTAWWIPSDQRRFSTTLPVNCSHKPATRHQNICIYCPWRQFLMLWQAGFQANISRNSFNIQRWPAKMDTAGNSPNLINNLNLTVLHNVMDIPLVELLCLQSSHNKPATFLTLLTSKSCWHWHWKQSKKTHIFAPSACWQDCHRIVAKISKMKCKGQDRQTEPRGRSHPKDPQFQELTLQQLHPPQLTPRSCLWSPPYSAAMYADDYETLPFFLKNKMEIWLQDSNQLST